MLATRALMETGVSIGRRVVLLWTTDEEIGSATSRAAIEDEARRSDAVLVLEPSLPGGAVKTGRKGCGQYEIVVRGVAAHAGIDPSKGASAIHELAHQICRLYRLPKQWGGLTLNVGTIAGGSRANVVADEARAVIDVRAAGRNEMTMFDGIVRRQTPRDPRTSLEVSGGFDRPPLERTAQVARLYQQASEVAHELGQTLGEGSTGRARHSDVRWPRCDRRRRPRAARARRYRVVARSGRPRGGVDRKDRITISGRRPALSVKTVLRAESR